MGMVIRLLVAALIIYIVYSVFKLIRYLMGAADNTVPLAKADNCPACGARIRVPEQPDKCPKCATPLGRSPEGKLLIRVN